MQIPPKIYDFLLRKLTKMKLQVGILSKAINSPTDS
jgi:hypothetical protein